MKIVIDTKVDSPEDIRKAIKVLSVLVGETPAYSQENHPPDMFSSSEPAPAGIFGNVFEAQPEEKPEKKDDMPEIIVY